MNYLPLLASRSLNKTRPDAGTTHDISAASVRSQIIYHRISSFTRPSFANIVGTEEPSTTKSSTRISGETDWACGVVIQYVDASSSAIRPPIQLERVFRSEIEQEFRRAFAMAAEEDFEPGMASQFSRELTRLTTFHRAESENIIRKLVMQTKSKDVAAEVMNWLSRSEGILADQVRAGLLHAGLISDSVLVRDAAAVGMGRIVHPLAVRLLSRAIASEPNRELKGDMEQVLEELKNKQNAQITSLGQES